MRRASVEKSLKDLCCSHLDLLLIHWPEAWVPGTEKPDTTVTHLQTWCALSLSLGFWAGDARVWF